jgi:hypothetical protein
MSSPSSPRHPTNGDTQTTRFTRRTPARVRSDRLPPPQRRRARVFCDVEQRRGLATRYEKLALTFRGAAVLKAIVTWLHALACR